MSYKNKYPFVFVGGMLSWGEENSMYSKLPYWGMVCGNLVKQLRESGIEAYAPQLGPLNSAWERACELYAVITGTRVDYGKARAKEYKHSQYGRTYTTPLVPNWGKPRADGTIQKVHLLGHSFGGATMRMLAELLTNGSEAERKASGKDVSPLFEGGHGDWIATITAIESPHDGTTFVHAFPKFMKVVTAASLVGLTVLGNTRGNKVYDSHLEQYGLTVPAGETNYKKLLDPTILLGMRKVLKTGNHVFHDLRIDEASKLNDFIHTSPDIYYFSIAGEGTKPDKKNPDFQVRAPIMIFAFIPFAKIMGKFPEQKIGDYTTTKTWRINDGLVPLESALYPHKEPHDIYEEVKNQPLKKGIWHVMPNYIGDHGTAIGGSLSYIGPGRPDKYRNYWRSHLNMLMQLED